MTLAGSRDAFGINTYSYTLTHSARDCVTHLAAQGLRSFELMAAPGHLWPAQMDASHRRELKAVFDDNGLGLVSLNMPSMDINFAAAAPEMQAYTLDLMRALVILAGDLGARQVLIAPGKANPLYSPPRAQLVDRFYAALDTLHPLARDNGTALVVENIPICFVPDAKGLMTLIDEYGQDDIGIVYDVANAHFIGEDIGEGLMDVKRRLALVHLSDTGRDVWKHDPVGQGTIAFDTMPDLLREAGYDQKPVLEIISTKADEDVIGSVDSLRAMGWH